jgi:hypothetical protein
VSYKSFKNAAFLVVFDTSRQATGQILYEEVNKRYRDKGGDLPIVNAETTAASAIYIVLSLTFFSVFFMEKRGELGFLAANTFLTAMLLANCAILLLVYLKRGHTETIWTRVRDELNEPQG